VFLAGKVFLQYRKRQEQKGNVLPGCFIGAHAALSGYQLITRDRRRFSTYFPSIELIMPNSNNELDWKTLKNRFIVMAVGRNSSGGIHYAIPPYAGCFTLVG
jgi:hypothetical protein